MQAASDIFLGWERVAGGLDGQAHDYYMRQMWDWKISADVESMPPEEIMIYAENVRLDAGARPCPLW